MPQEIKRISGGVNSYLIKGDQGYVMIDTGIPGARSKIEKELEAAGCGPGDLKLIVLTHGDYDHAGNADYLREKHGARIAMHEADFGMVETGDMKWNRKPKPDRLSLIFKVMQLFFKSAKLDTFKPDLAIDEDFDFSTYGLDARVLHIPGHSKGSIGVLTGEGDLFCGDLLYNMGMGTPIIDDVASFTASVQRLKSLSITTIYPGHGKPFPMEKFMGKFRKVS